MHASNRPFRTATFEAWMLRGLFVAALMVAVLLAGAVHRDMDASPGQGDTLAAHLLSAPSRCPLPADGLLCPRQAA